MIYTSDRNYGCRYKEVIYHTLRTIILENEKISVIILADKGTDIISINYKPTDTEFMYTPPTGLSCLHKKNQLQFGKDFIVDNYFGGWFECFPNTGEPNEFGNRHFLNNDELTYLPWDVYPIEDTPEKVTLKFTAVCAKLPYKVEKYITVKSGIPSIFIEETATNLSYKKQPYLWGQHPIVGGKFLNENVRIDLPGASVSPFCPRKGKEYTEKWPYATIGGKKTDCRIFPKTGSQDGILLHMADLEDNWGAIRNEELKLGIGYSWDSSIFDHAILWLHGGDNTSPCNFGGMNLACIFPKSSNINTLKLAEEDGELSYIEGNSSISTWFTATVFEGDKPVTKIGRDGKVIF